MIEHLFEIEECNSKGQLFSKACIYMLINTQLTKSITWQDSLSEEHLKIIFRVPESRYTLGDLKEKKDASNIVGFIFFNRTECDDGSVRSWRKLSHDSLTTMRLICDGSSAVSQY